MRGISKAAAASSLAFLLAAGCGDDSTDATAMDSGTTPDARDTTDAPQRLDAPATDAPVPTDAPMIEDCNSPFAGLYLWKIGNCEAGLIEPVDSDTCEAVHCASNAREPEDCDTVSVPVLFDGTEASYVMAGMVVGRISYERSIDCTTETSISAATCARFECIVTNFDDVYIERAIDRPADEQLHADGLWIVQDRPWPATNACRTDATIDTIQAQIDTTCP